MLRLLYLLARQEARRARSASAAAPSPRQRQRYAFVAGAVGLAAGAAAVGLAIAVRSHSVPAPPVAVEPTAAALDLHIEAVESTPLVVFLEAPGSSGRERSRAAARPVHIRSVNSSFQPSFQVAPVASRIEVGNDDAIPHNTHVFDGRRTLFNVAVPLSGVRVHKVLGRPGIFDVRCDFHQWMRAWVFVPPNAHHAVIWQSGQVILRDIPPGAYRLHTWTPARGDTVRALTLSSGEVKSLHLAGT